MRDFRSRLALTFGLAVALTLGGGCVINLPVPKGSGELTQITIRDGGFYSPGKILLVDISGIIGVSPSPGLFGADLDTITLVSESLSKAAKDKSIKAVVVRIDSPGGTVTASDILYKELKQFSEEREDVKIYASMLGLAASGGYYVAMAADEVGAHPTTVTGSIGVIAQFPSVKKLTEWIGIEMRTFQSGENKDIGSIFEDFTEEQRQILQSTIDDMYARFLEVVKAGRPDLEEERIRELADGRIYTASQAKENGLIDVIEYLPELIDRIEDEQGGTMDIVTYDPTFAEGSSLYASRYSARGRAGGEKSTRIPAQIEVHHTVAGFPARLEPGFYYLWLE